VAPLGEDNPHVISALEAYIAALRAGRPWSRDEFLRRHAEIAEALNQCLTGLEFIESAAVQLDGSGPFSGGKPAVGVSASARLGDYEILREVGRGGMGVVYEAEQVSLGRRVALKVLPFAAAIDPRQRQRFQIEAQAAAQLHHPHIVPIFGVGCDHGIHYYAMQFVEGRSLAAILHELRAGHEQPAFGETHPSADAAAKTLERSGAAGDARIDPEGMPAGAAAPSRSVANPPAATDTVAAPELAPFSNGQSQARTASGSVHRDRAYCRNIARLGAQVADALEHAHGLGILHRDIKPANLLIDRHGAVWITDFGLARFPSDLSLTQTGDLVGTLRYMSPEQALARRGVVDQRTDIYSLGVTLYELLALRPAFDGRDHQELLRQIAMDEPVPPRRLNPAIPRDLETVILKATAKDPSSRYTTAAELAGDLQRFLDDRAILARRPGPLERTLRWARRRKELVGTAAAILGLALVIGTAATWDQARRREAASRGHHAYIVQTFPLFDRLAMDAMGEATKLIMGTPDAETREMATLVHQDALSAFTQASELPPSDVESRRIIARAYKQLGFARGVLSGINRGTAAPNRELLSQSEADYRRALALYEELYAESPRNLKVRRNFAEALGTWGWGWLLYTTKRSEEADPHYRRAVQFWRELVHEIGAAGCAGSSAPGNAVYEFKDLTNLADTVQMLSGMLDVKGQTQAAERLRQELVDDVAGVVARLNGPAHQARRRSWGHEFFRMGKSSLGYGHVQVARLSYELAIILDPENGEAHNDLAWLLVRFPCDPGHDPTKGVTLAQKAVTLTPNNWMFWNTLGVAAYRNGDWKTADDSLRKSTKYTGGGAIDWFFLAMNSWRQGNEREARLWFDRAVASIKKENQPENNNHEVTYFHAEAATVMGLPGPTVGPFTPRAAPDANPSATVQKASPDSERNEKGG
jgi:serine/threonine protein kinase